MIINKLEIKNFGKFQETQIKFGAGIHVVYGENESGKSTLHTFIRSMLFGVEQIQGQQEETDSYNLCQPWENPTYYGGSMEFTCGGKHLRLSRSFYKESEKVCVVNLENKQQPSGGKQQLKSLLGSIHAGIFDNTVSIGQLKCATDRSLAQQLQSDLASYEGGGDVQFNPFAAIDRLKEKKHMLEEQKKQQQEKQQIYMEKLEAKMELLQSQQKSCQSRMQEFQKKAGEEMPFEKQQIEKEKSQLPVWSVWNFRHMCIYFALFCTIAALLFLILGFVFWGEGKSLLFFMLAALGGLLVPLSFFMQERWKGSVPEMPSKQRPRKEEKHQKQSRETYRQLQEEWQERQVMMENLRQEMQEIDNRKCDTTQIEEEIEAVHYAISMLEKTVRGMQKGAGGKIRKRTGEILSELTDGKYSRILIDSNMEIRIQTPQKAIELRQMSRGTLEQVYFALRMAVSEVLCAKETMPVILDDVFAMYDEKRLQKALKWLVDHKEQVIILTCHKREGEILDSMGVLYRKIFLHT